MKQRWVKPEKLGVSYLLPDIIIEKNHFNRACLYNGTGRLISILESGGFQTFCSAEQEDIPYLERAIIYKNNITAGSPKCCLIYMPSHSVSEVINDVIDWAKKKRSQNEYFAVKFRELDNNNCSIMISLDSITVQESYMIPIHRRHYYQIKEEVPEIMPCESVEKELESEGKMMESQKTNNDKEEKKLGLIIKKQSLFISNRAYSQIMELKNKKEWHESTILERAIAEFYDKVTNQDIVNNEFDNSADYNLKDYFLLDIDVMPETFFMYLSNNEEFSELINKLQFYYGRFLTEFEKRFVFEIKYYFMFSDESIIKTAEYLLDENKSDIKDLSETLKDWKEQGINSLEDIRLQIEISKKNKKENPVKNEIRLILDKIYINNDSLVPITKGDVTLYNKWITMNFSKEDILNAMKICYRKKGIIIFPYVNGILKNMRLKEQNNLQQQ